MRKLNKTSKKITLSIIVVLVTLTSLIIYNYDGRPALKIAYIGRYTSPTDSPKELERNAKFQSLHEFALHSFIDEYNKNSPIKIELIKFDNQKTPEKTNKIYDEIISNQEIIAVIDNAWTKENSIVSDKVKESGLPVIFINSDKNGIDYGKSSLFTSSTDSEEIEGIAKYLKSGLKRDTINFISERNDHNHYNYIEAIKSNGIHIADSLFFETLKIKNKDKASSKLSKLLDNDYPIIINSHTEIGNFVVSELNKNQTNKTLLGHAQILSYGSIIEHNPNNSIILMSLSENAVSREILDKIKEFKLTYGNETEDLNLSLFIKRCKDAWDIIEYSLPKNANITRKVISEKFQSLSNFGLETEDDYLFFNSKRELKREYSFIEFTQNEDVILPKQLNSTNEIISSLNFGIEVINIQNIDLFSNTFECDFYYWINSSAQIDTLGNILTFQNIKPSESRIELVSKNTTNETNYQLYKVSGKFFKEYDVSDYPFDKQEISIDVQLLKSSDDLKIAYDKEGYKEGLSKFNLNGWRTDDFFVTVDNKITKRLKGNHDKSKNEINIFKNISFQFQVSRSITSGILQIVLPLFFIGIIAITLLFLKDLTFSNIGESLGAIFLTAIAFSISISDVSPVGGVLTKTDFLFMTTLSVVVICYLLGLYINSKTKVKSKLIKYFRITLMISYLIIFSFIILK